MMTIKPFFSALHNLLETYERIFNQQSGIDKEKVFHVNVAFIHKLGFTNKPRNNQSHLEPWIVH